MSEWALVTGGSRNIGEGIAKRLIADGFKVMTASRTPPEHDGYTEYLELDFEDPAAAAAKLKAAIGDRPFTRFVHNAAVSNTDLGDKISAADMARLYAVNTISFVSLAQAVIPAMRRAGVGRIVAISSRASLGKIGRVAYAGSKAALTGVIRSLALELGGDGITVNGIAPGPVETSMFRNSTMPGSLDWHNLNYGIPVGFIAESADIAHSVSYFVSDEARFVTGQMLFVCGGTSIGFVSAENRKIEHRFAKAYPHAG